MIYIYGPSGLPVEQVSSGGTVTYLHHDQQGSTRLLTGSTGTVTGSTTFDAYGNKTGSTGTSTTPLGYDAQYTNSDTGLIYLRARVYDPGTAQFLTVDPIETLTRAPYDYADDNSVNYIDRTGLCSIIPGSSENCFSEAPNAVGSVLESVAQHPVEAGGIILGGISLVTGAGEVIGVGAAGGEAAISLGGVSTVSGIGAAGLDLKSCAGGAAAACIGAGVGVVASGGALVVVGGLVSGVAASGATAISLSSGALSFVTDLAGALNPSSASGFPRGSATDCG